MKFFKLLFLVLFISFTTVLSAKETNFADSSSRNLGVGMSLFYPTGFTAKYLMDEKLSWESSWGYVEGRAHGHSVLLYNVLELSKSSRFFLYFGAGFSYQERKRSTQFSQFKDFKWINSSTFSATGFRVPLGISYFSDDSPIEIFGEANMNLFFGRDAGSEMGGAIGTRYYF